ncbi:Hypothetical protein GbCGDNIH7_1923 [Granulibacter bethesdensis]|nr:Hypothetical protein GbCGDNIH7_1923 [Granulibacter bethesdensis]
MLADVARGRLSPAAFQRQEAIWHKMHKTGYMIGKYIVTTAHGVWIL